MEHLIRGLSISLNDPNWRRLLNRKLKVFSVVLPSKNIGLFRRTLERSYTWENSRRKALSQVDASTKRIILNPLLKETDIKELETKYGVFFRINNIKLEPYELELDYDFWTFDEIINAILPEDLERISSFEQVGHLIHLNLPSVQYAPFERVIGQVLLDKNPSSRTVVNKIGEIQSVFRVFPMKVIAGVEDFNVIIKQNRCIFEFDYSKVYWNSRLEAEHTRIVSLLKPGDVVFDVFCGVGPFAIPAAKKGCTVFANDLNTEAINALRKIQRKNKLDENSLRSYNFDGHEFVRRSPDLLEHLSFKRIRASQASLHYLMNLPAFSLEFLPTFLEILPEFDPSPWIHLYLFCRSNEDPLDFIRKIIPEISEPNVHNVRSVAPNKDMFCVSFRSILNK